ncbi:MAG: Protein of unknown function (DUF1553)/Protein of unknown function (DUF1549)/Planctomycete [Chthoniobacteraceae bacterium]|nr:Protein of unknown function (DUF1553)/Protein of unknown function (DUF1549)/Planctomycete [Chthoniobacteraceae bacterium]
MLMIGWCNGYYCMFSALAGCVRFYRVICFLLVPLATRVMAAEEGDAFFESRIRPALVEYCYKCHAADSEKIKGELLLDTREGLRKGGESGASIVPGKPEESLLIKAIRRLDKDLAMPPKLEMPEAVVNDFVAWVKMGAPDPRTAVAAAAGEAPAAKIDYAAERKKWAFHKPELPTVPDGAEADPIDRFLAAKYQAAHINPAPKADKRTLIRRATFDLTGLPPAPEEVTAFVADESPGAFEKVIERLLASPHYGEQWGRHWLDLTRYADSLDARSGGREGDILDAWRYRDWVVDAFNRDLPYNDFVTYQVAGDLLAAKGADPSLTIATGLYAIGNWGNGDADKEKIYTDIVDDQIDVTGRAFLGLTLACARCHDHKFDPISTADYYSLAGIFFSSHILEKFTPKGQGENMMRISLLTPAERAAREIATARMAAITAQLAGGLRPLTEVKRDLNGIPGLINWIGKGAENPSLLINTTAAEIAFSTIRLPARSIVLHPGPKTAATAVWRSPVSGKVRVSAKVRDADPNCGDGIAWAIRHGAKELASGKMENGGASDFPEREVAVEAGDLLELVVSPAGEYSCDSTVCEFVVKGDQVWDLRDALVAGATQGDGNLWWICAGEGARLGQDSTNVAALEAEQKQLAAELAVLRQCQGLQEGGIPGTAYAGIHDARIHVRGRYDRLKEVRPRGFPALLSDAHDSQITEGSGRIELARWLASPENPLTARVMMNRIWQHHFGDGIVRTPNNYGKLGSAPTHPELLDWLALELVKNNWSVKAMHRLIMRSAAYQRASDANADPENQWFARQNRRRLSAEELRDSLLTASGTLNQTVGGLSIGDLNTPRRTLYVTTIRSDRATYQMLFDGADPTGIVDKRTDSVVAPQALWLLNSPFALAQTSAFMRRMEREAPPDSAGRIAWIYERLFARLPTDDELRIATGALAHLKTNAWEQLCQVFLCSNEFSYVD